MLTQSQIKFVRSLHQKKFREEHRQFITEGTTLVKELLQSDHPVEALYASKNWMEENRDAAEKRNIRIFEASEKDLERISCLTTPNQVLAVLNIPEERKIAVEKNDGLILLFDHISDPGNLGTIIRTADWFGIRNIFCSLDCVELYNPKVIQATMGSFLRVNINYIDPEKILSEIKGRRPVYGAFMQGEAVEELKKNNNACIIIGSESKGISKELEHFIDKRISIPSGYSETQPGAESLNVTIATGIICYEFTR